MTQAFFKHFRCRRLSPDLRVLESDYTILCAPDVDEFAWDDVNSQWWLLAIISVVGLTFLSVGFPISAFLTSSAAHGWWF